MPPAALPEKIFCKIIFHLTWDYANWTTCDLKADVNCRKSGEISLSNVCDSVVEDTCCNDDGLTGSCSRTSDDLSAETTNALRENLKKKKYHSSF